MLINSFVQPGTMYITPGIYTDISCDLFPAEYLCQWSDTRKYPFFKNNSNL